MGIVDSIKEKITGAKMYAGRTKIGIERDISNKMHARAKQQKFDAGMNLLYKKEQDRSYREARFKEEKKRGARYSKEDTAPPAKQPAFGKSSSQAPAFDFMTGGMFDNYGQRYARPAKRAKHSGSCCKQKCKQKSKTKRRARDSRPSYSDFERSLTNSFF